MSSPSSSQRKTAATALFRLVFPALLVLTLFVSGCASMLDPGPPPTRIQLHPAAPEKAAKKLNKQVIVALPQAERDIDSDGIALLFNGREIRYLSGVRWTTTVPMMVQRDLIDALIISEGLRGVADEAAGISSNAKILCDIKQFSLRYESETAPPTAWFVATFRIVDQNNGRVLDSKAIDITVPAFSTETAALVQACETALSKGLAEVTTWTLATLK